MMKLIFITEDSWELIKSLQGKDFSAIEDNEKAFEIISNLAAIAGQSAVAEAIAAGLPRVFVRNDKIIRLYSDGKEEILSDTTTGRKKVYYYHSPTTVFHVLKK